jgi:hypothetical protein
MPEPKLLPCPFCGPGNSCVELYQDDHGYWTVGCGRCGSHSGRLPGSRPDSRQRIIDGWNRRHSPAPMDPFDAHYGEPE